MNKPTLLIGLLVAGLAIFFTGIWIGSRTPASTKSATAARPLLYYACPMHPQYHSDKPGDCPSCGMRLEAVFADGTGGAAAPVDSATFVKVTAERQQSIGVRVVVAEKARSEQVLRSAGRVAPDERRVYKLNASTDFWVREVFPPTTGSQVGRNAPLLAFYSPNYLSTASSYLYALDTEDRAKAALSGGKEQLDVVQLRVRQAVESLRSLGVSEYQIEEMAKTRAGGELVTVRSPVDGFILSRNVSAGEFVESGSELYRIVDLARVWILADIFEAEAEYIKPGVTARVMLRQGRHNFKALVSDVPPLFDDATRTLKVRLEVHNPGYTLKPGMFVDVDFAVTLPAGVTVPSEAVVDSGLRRTVFVDRGNGYFEPRRVETGWRMGERVQIVSGLSAGERIAVSGAFLLDSESRMRAAAAGIVHPESDPVCGMDVDRDKATQAGRKVAYEGATYYFCSDQCKKDFEKNPKQYLKK